MAQTIVVILIISVAAIIAVIKLYRFFTTMRGDTDCHTDACGSCPYYVEKECGKKDKQ
jgi:hypothetical protein